MIDERIKIHDKYQFEVKLGYTLSDNEKETSYNIETYFFIPNSLDINSQTYKKEDFYNDLKTYIRLKTPTFLLRNIATGNTSPISQLRASINELVAKPSKTGFSNYENQIKLVCSIFKSALRDHIDFIAKKENRGDIESLIDQLIQSIKKITHNYRELRSIIDVPVVPRSKYSVFLFGNEYISLLIESEIYRLLESMHSKGCQITPRQRSQLLQLVKTEVAYRKKNRFPSIPSEKNDNEELVYRQSVLKRYMASILFLRTHKEPEGKVLEQIFFIFAAALAMIFATAVTFFSQYRYGGLTFPLFIAIVISYIFKDRIKEFMRLYFMIKVQNTLFDHKKFIYSNPKEKIGYCQESVDFIKERKVPDTILKLRNRAHITDIENGWLGEKIIFHRKHVNLFSKKIKQVYQNFRIEGINDIVRFNVFKYLNKMDNPEKALYIATDNAYEKIYAERVYHLNMIIRYLVGNRSLYRRFRIVLNRDGIKRIEKVISDED